MASPASPPHYMYNPVKVSSYFVLISAYAIFIIAHTRNLLQTIKTNTVGTVNALGLAKRVNAKILIASTSEVYGDPEVSPIRGANYNEILAGN